MMREYHFEYKLSELEKGVLDLKKGVDSIKERVSSTDLLWDNSDLIQNWHVSPRTLASWRAKQIIDYVKIGKKIYYAKADRDRFIEKYHVRNLKKNEY
jgi:hypothetical protein